MTVKISRYIDPLTDFGFKHLFGQEPNKDILIAFLNALFQGEKQIVDLRFDGDHMAEKKVFFDLTCTGKDGERFIIEMQRGHQEFFSDRCIFYMSRLISAQLPKGSSTWNSPLKEVYLIGILDFKFSSFKSNYLHNIALMNKDTGKLFYKGMGYKFLELRNFDKQAHELESELDKWFYLLKNLSHLDKIPDFMDKRIFQKVFKIAEMSNLTKEELELFQSDVRAKSDWNGNLNWARKQGKLDVALKMKEKGSSYEDIAELTGLSIEELQ